MANVQATAWAAGILSSLFFIFVNAAMNIYTKWLFSESGGNWPLPWTMLAVQQFQTYLVLQPSLILMRRRGLDGGGKDKDGNGNETDDAVSFRSLMSVVAVTVLFCLNAGLNSLSLVEISITLNQTIRAFLPVGVLLVATCVEQRSYPPHSYLTTGLLVVGIGLTCWSSPDFQLYGFFLAFASTLVAAVGTSLNGRLLSRGPFSKSAGKSGPYGIVQLTLIQSVPAFALFSAIAFFTEGSSVMDKFRHNSEAHWTWQSTLGLLSISSVLALLTNLSRFLLVSATSALMEALAGNAKVATLCVIDHECFGTVLYVYNYAGICITIVGFGAHIFLQWSTKEPEGKKPHSQVADGSQKPGSKRVLHRPRLISAAETGLAAEHVAVEFGRDYSKFGEHWGRGGSGGSTSTTAASSNGVPELRRHRSVTWPEAAPKERRVGMWDGLDFSLAYAVPQWLRTEDYTPVSMLSPMTGGQSVARMPSEAEMTALASVTRGRSLSDPTERRGGLEDIWQRVPLQSGLRPVEEEGDQTDAEIGDPPDLDWL